jgi:nucleoside-diphosphate-sugar epimerase
VKSVVYTSDSFAVWFPRTEQQFTVHPWQYNQDAGVALRKGKRLPAISDELIVWATAKVAAEKAVWNFVKDHQPSFEASSIVPNMNFGPSVRPLPLSSTGTCIPSLLRGEDPTSTFYFPAAHFVNVRDCAKLHIAALLDPEQSERRLFACAAPYSWNDILCILRKLRPHASMRKDYDQFGRDESVLPNDAAEQLLKKWYGHGWTGLEETVRQNIDGV